MNFDRYTDEYLKNYDFERIQVRYRRRKVLEVLTDRNARSVLEVGCGLEPLFCFTGPMDSHVVVEPAPAFAENAIKLSAGRPGVRVVFGTLEDNEAKLGDEAFDLIVASSVLHEVAEPTAFLDSLRRVSAEHTVVHLNVPNATSFHRALALRMGLLKDLGAISPLGETMQRTAVHNRITLRAIVEGAGFRVLSEGSYFIKPFTHAQMACAVESGLVDDTILDGLYELSRDFPDAGSEIFVNAVRR